jgi:hypothetical protein
MGADFVEISSNRTTDLLKLHKGVSGPFNGVEVDLGLRHSDVEVFRRASVFLPRQDSRYDLTVILQKPAQVGFGHTAVPQLRLVAGRRRVRLDFTLAGHEVPAFS